MASHKNYRRDKFQATKESNRNDINNPSFVNNIQARDSDKSTFEKNLNKWIFFIQWAKWFPDLFYDLITPEKGGMRLDLDQRMFLRCMSRFLVTYGVFPRGFGKCVTQDTMLFTTDGIKEIGEYFNYSKDPDEFYTTHDIELINRYGVIEKSNKGVHSGLKPTKKIITEEGYELEGTLVHPVLVMCENGELKYKKLLEIKMGDYLPISRNNDIWGNRTNLDINMGSFLNSLSKSSKPKVLRAKCNTPTVLSEDLALIIGYLLGDGTMTRKNRVGFTNKDEDMVNKFISYFEGILNIKVRKKTDIDYEVNGLYVREYFRQIGLNYCDAYTKEIPKCILQAPKEIVVKCLQGLFDTDGGLNNSGIEYTTASEKMSKQVQMLLLNLGIICSRRIKYNKKFKTKSFNISIYSENVNKFYGIIGFSCNRKQEKLKQMCNTKRNPNKDIIPYQKNKITKIHPRGATRDKLYHVLVGNNELTYSKCNLLLENGSIKNKDTVEYIELEKLYSNKYFYSKVKSIENREALVCDLQMSDTHSFVSNGFISHNTMIEIMSIYHTCIFFPDITMAMSAQTRENATSISEEKHKEIIKWFPLIRNEIVKSSFTKDSVEVIFSSGGTYSVLANSQSSKGQRRRRLNIEESALLNNELFKDALEPVVNVPRRTIGERAEVNPYELNGMINYVTTSGYRGSDEFVRILNLLDEMADLKGKIVLGASWELPCHYGRGETKSQILAKKNDPTTSALSFAMNYESRWTGASDGALININKLLNAQTLKLPELECPKDKNGNFELNEYVMGVDVARSSAQSNNKTAIVVLKILRNKEQRIRQVQLVNIETPPNGLTFEEQSLEVKKMFYRYGGNLNLNKSRVKAVVVDANNIGQGLVEKLLENIADPDTDEEYDGWATINTDDKSKNPKAPKVLYSLKAQGINADIIRTFIDYVESNKLKLLSKYQNIDKTNNKVKKLDEMSLKVVCEQTDALIDEVANLKIKQTKSTSSTITVEQVSRKVDKDRYSALVYALYYISLFMDDDVVEDETTLLDYCYYL